MSACPFERLKELNLSVIAPNNLGPNQRCALCPREISFARRDQVARHNQCGNEFHMQCMLLHLLVAQDDLCPQCGTDLAPHANEAHIIEESGDQAHELAGSVLEGHLVTSFADIALVAASGETPEELDALRAHVQREIERVVRNNIPPVRLNQLLTRPHYGLNPANPRYQMGSIDQHTFARGWFISRLLGRDLYRGIYIDSSSFGLLRVWMPDVGRIEFYPSFDCLEIPLGRERFERLRDEGASNLQVPLTHAIMHQVLDAANIWSDVSPDSIALFERYSIHNPNACWKIVSVDSIDPHFGSRFVIPWPESDELPLPIGYPELRQMMRFHDLPPRWLEETLTEYLRNLWSSWHSNRETFLPETIGPEPPEDPQEGLAMIWWRRLPEEAEEFLTTRRGPHPSRDPACGICLENIAVNEKTLEHTGTDTEPGCGVYWHYRCLSEYIASFPRRLLCPICRKIIAKQRHERGEELEELEDEWEDERRQWNEDGEFDFIGGELESFMVDHHVVESVDEITSLFRPHNLESMQQARRVLRQGFHPGPDGFLYEGSRLNKQHLDYIRGFPEYALDHADRATLGFYELFVGCSEYERLVFHERIFDMPLALYVPRIGKIQFCVSVEYIETIISNEMYQNFIEHGPVNHQIPWTHRMMRWLLETVNFYGDVDPEAIRAFENYARANPQQRWGLFNIRDGFRQLGLFVVPWPAEALIAQADPTSTRLPVLGYPGVPQTNLVQPGHNDSLFNEQGQDVQVMIRDLHPELVLDHQQPPPGALNQTATSMQRIVQDLGEILGESASSQHREEFFAEIARRSRIWRVRNRNRKNNVSRYPDQQPGNRVRWDIYGNQHNIEE